MFEQKKQLLTVYNNIQFRRTGPWSGSTLGPVGGPPWSGATLDPVRGRSPRKEALASPTFQGERSPWLSAPPSKPGLDIEFIVLVPKAIQEGKKGKKLAPKHVLKDVKHVAHKQK